MNKENINKFSQVFKQWSYIKYGNDLHCIEMLNAQISYLENELEKENQENAEINEQEEAIYGQVSEFATREHVKDYLKRNDPLSFENVCKMLYPEKFKGGTK